MLGFVTPVRAYLHDGQIYTHVSSGRIAEGLAEHYDTVLLCTRALHVPPTSTTDLALTAPNVELIAQPFWPTSLGALRYVVPISRSYFQICKRSDVLFVRGMCPFIAVLYFFAWLFRRPVCHWIVGDPIAVLRASRRRGWLIDSLSLLYAWQDRFFSRVGRWLTGGAFICNGQLLARAYTSPRTVATVSSTVTNDEFVLREDTCENPLIRILFVGVIRPEKGIEYLIEAVSQLRIDRPWQLEIVGPDEFSDYRQTLDRLVHDLGLERNVTFSGYVAYGADMAAKLRTGDMLVLPTLSEGTPHVLVEARASSLPCISTTVGGVPSTVTDGFDAILVPPKDAAALARAIARIVEDGELRRSLIRNGLAAARQQTLEAFVALALRALEDQDGDGRTLALESVQSREPAGK